MLTHEAHAAIYAAKGQGKNRLERSEPNGQQPLRNGRVPISAE